MSLFDRIVGEMDKSMDKYIAPIKRGAAAVPARWDYEEGRFVDEMTGDMSRRKQKSLRPLGDILYKAVSVSLSPELGIDSKDEKTVNRLTSVVLAGYSMRVNWPK